MRKKLSRATIVANSKNANIQRVNAFASKVVVIDWAFEAQRIRVFALPHSGVAFVLSAKLLISHTNSVWAQSELCFLSFDRCCLLSMFARELSKLSRGWSQSEAAFGRVCGGLHKEQHCRCFVTEATGATTVLHAHLHLAVRRSQHFTLSAFSSPPSRPLHALSLSRFFTITLPPSILSAISASSFA